MEKAAPRLKSRGAGRIFLSRAGEGQQPQSQPQQKGGSVRELSDELERLSQRYGSSMEDWLYDQSAL